MDTPAWVGVDIGGTKIAAGLIHLTAAGQASIRARADAATPRTGHRDVLATAATLIATLTRQAAGRACAVGVGAPGVIDPDSGQVRAATNILPGWVGAPVRQTLHHASGLPVRVDNDVRVMARGEARYGAGRDYPRAVYVSLGTGVGGALTCHGQPIRGAHGTAGELAHLLVPARGALPCGCGRHDHLEAVAAGPAIAAAYARRTGLAPPPPLTEVGARLAAGDPDAGAAVTDAARLLGRALAGLVTALDADAVIIGGGVARLGEPLFTPLREALHHETLARPDPVPVLPAALGADGPVLGAALLALDAHGPTTRRATERRA